MKSILPLLAVSILLAACASIPQVTVTPEATATSIPISTPLSAMSPTPVAVDWVANVDGTLYVFDGTAQEWKALPALTKPYEKVQVNEDGLVVALDEYGEAKYWFNAVTENWVEMEKEITSCVSPEAIAAQDAEFEGRTGIDLNDPGADGKSQKFIEYINAFNSTGVSPEIPEVVTIQFVKTGFGIVKTGDDFGDGVDSLVCLYGRNGVIRDKTFSFVAGWIDVRGDYHPLSMGFDYVTGQDLSISYEKRQGSGSYDPKALLAFAQGIPDGAHIQIDVHAMGGVKVVDDASSSQAGNQGIDNEVVVRDFLSILTQKPFPQDKRSSDVVAYYEEQFDLEGGIGFIPASHWLYLDPYESD